MVILYIFLTGVLVTAAIGWVLSGPAYHGPASDHFNGKRFFNPDHPPAKGFWALLKWLFSRKRGQWEKMHNRSASESPEKEISDRLRITFVNHTTFLIQFDGINLLTDPVWAERVSPFSWAGPTRMRPPGIPLNELPAIHLVLLSHNHYDHLDIATVGSLNQKFKPMFVTPLGVTSLLIRNNITSGIELDWWEEKEIFPDVSVTCVPAMHFSGRGMFDRDRTLWSGFFVRTRFGNVYFAGDIGYNPKVFQTIGKRCSPIHVAIIPIGAYKPGWFMRSIHCSPEEAIRIHRDVRSRLSIASHFGTFPLPDDSQLDPLEDLATALQPGGGEPFIVLQEGRFIDLEKP